MERHQEFGAGSTGQPWGNDVAPIAGASRRQAFDQLRLAVEHDRGPVLITGEPGAGKSWLAERLAGALPSMWAVVSVDLAPALGAVDFLRLVGDALGVKARRTLAGARLRVRRALEDDAADGHRWLLVVDDAHQGSSEVWAEVQSIVHQLGRPGGFAALMVLGQTELVRELAGRRRCPFGSSVALHLHLMPLDLDEARELLGLEESTGDTVEAALENLHRDARGNPGRMLGLMQSRPELLCAEDATNSQLTTRVDPVQSRPELVSATGGGPRLGGGSGVTARATPAAFGLAVLNHPPEDAEPLETSPPATTALEGNSQSSMPPLFPSKPPLRSEEGLIEVGWGGDPDPALGPARNPSEEPPRGPEPDVALQEEPVLDTYAALQAWTEWTRNQARQSATAAAASVPATLHAEVPSEPESPRVDAAASVADPPATLAAASIRAEGQHEFAPYSQLFTRHRQSKQPGG
jgi:general secretion pathway protein A